MVVCHDVDEPGACHGPLPVAQDHVLWCSVHGSNAESVGIGLGIGLAVAIDTFIVETGLTNRATTIPEFCQHGDHAISKNRRRSGSEALSLPSARFRGMDCDARKS